MGKILTKPKRSWSLTFTGKGRLAVFVSGFTMLMVQVVLLREFTSLYSVNELIVGIFLSFWMLFTGAGAYTARYFGNYQWSYAGLFPLISGVSAYVALWLLYLLKGWMVPEGVAPQLSQWLLTTGLVTFVFCFPSGMLFTWFAGALSNVTGMRQTEHLYIAEQKGSLLSGLLFSFAALLWMDAFSVLSFLLLINMVIAIVLFAPIKQPVYRYLALISIAVVAILNFMPQYNFAREKIHDSALCQTFFSPYGHIDLLGCDTSIEFFGNGHYYSDRLVPDYREEMLHPALLLHPAPKRLLLINCTPGLTVEALKYDSLQIDFISPDRAHIHMEKALLANFNKRSERIHFIHDDPLRYLKRHKSEKGYDVILVGGGIPVDLATTRFFTTDFYSQVKRNLNEGGLMVTGGIDNVPYWSESVKNILNIIEETVSSVFPFLRIWAGEKVWLIASEKSIVAQWWDYHPEVVAQNQLVNRDYFPTLLLDQQISKVEEIVAGGGPVNTRERPVMFQMALREIGNFWDVSIQWFAGVVVVLLVMGIIVFRSVSRGVFLSGIVLGGMQVVMLLMWQLVMGDLYRATGVLFSLFMAGLALGAILAKREVFFFQARYYSVMLIIMALLCIMAVPVADRTAGLIVFPVVVLVMIFILAMLGGGVFVAGLSLYRGSIAQGAAGIYVADGAGGALGSVITAIFFVPYVGIVNTGYLLGMGLLIGGLLLIKNNS
ncbi:spermine/spermidine synthase domain-containing protein [Thermophagus xiamenensis]|uniref:spermine/spermidine synthase domain-containing protein n=1 Tax=Thermophagus xiamenensis TaxID=385682 RepID=UPI000255DAFD|nr:spermine synthase [Thermophagus xiamenensis]